MTRAALGNLSAGVGAVVALLITIGCAFDIDETANVLPEASAPDVAAVDAAPDLGDGVDMGDLGPPSPACDDCVQPGDWFRFSRLAVTKLAGSTTGIVNVLNPLWAGDISRYDLNVLIEVVRVEGRQLELRVVNAARTDTCGGQGICVLPETEVTMLMDRAHADRCRITTAEASSINVYAGNETNPKNCAPALDIPHTIPVRRVQISARMSEDCSRIGDGMVIEAAIPFDELGRICTCSNPSCAEDCGPPDDAFVGASCDGCNANFRNLRDLMNIFAGGALSADCPLDDGSPGVCLDAVFDADRLPGPPPTCD
ncbi:MAG: hypothetical protein KC620_02085 [Myxococcales bacterium]|nr:hypothetical protein [Myxococcales bacterium]